jgi:hypothetical protein
MRFVVAALLSLLLVNARAFPAGESSAREGAQQVESGAKQVGRGVEDATKGIGTTVVGGEIEGAEKAAEPEAKRVWSKAKDGAVSVGHSVKNFFPKLFNN